MPADAFERYSAMFRSGPLVGTPEQVVERLQAAQAQGMTYAITNIAESAYDRSGVELFERTVVPDFAR